MPRIIFAAAMAAALATAFPPTPASAQKIGSGDPAPADQWSLADQTAKCAARHIEAYGFAHPESGLEAPPLNDSNIEFAGRFLSSNDWDVQRACLMVFQSIVGAHRAIEGR